MHHKHIKNEVIVQLKKEFPNWKKIPKKMKKEIANKVLKEIVDEYDFKQEISTPIEKLLGIENQIPEKGLIKLDKMTEYIEKIHSDRILKFSNYDRSAIYIKDKELQFVDRIIDDRVINTLLSYDGYSPAQRDVLPCHLLRAELLVSLWDLKTLAFRRQLIVSTEYGTLPKDIPYSIRYQVPLCVDYKVP